MSTLTRVHFCVNSAVEHGFIFCFYETLLEKNSVEYTEQTGERITEGGQPLLNVVRFGDNFKSGPARMHISVQINTRSTAGDTHHICIQDASVSRRSAINVALLAGFR